MSEMRRLLMRMDGLADYANNPELREQAQQIDVPKLETHIERMTVRAAVLAHAFEVFKDGSHPHPMRAFLHATKCPAIHSERLADAEFYALLVLWGKLCDLASKDAGSHQMSFDVVENFRKQFTRVD